MIADVDVEGLDTAFVNARVLVNLPVGKRQTILVPRTAVNTRSGIDFVTVPSAEGQSARAVMLGETIVKDGATYVEILSGLASGDLVVTP